MAKLQFFKGTAAQVGAKNPEVGAVWFDTDSKVIKVKVAETGENAWDIFAGVQGADWDATTEVLTITKADGTPITVNLKNYAKASDFNTLKGSFEALQTAFATEQGYIDALQATVGDDSKGLVKGVADNTAAIAKLNGAADAEGSVAKAVADAVAAEAQIARAAEKANADAIDALETTVGENTAAIAELKTAVGEGDTVDEKITAKVESLDATVGSKTIAEGKHVAVEVVETDGVLTGLTVTENFTDITGAISAETTRATNAENAISARLNEGGDIATAIATEKGRVDTLVGADANMSARAIVQDEVAKQLESENISDSFDTLKEMAEYLSSHPQDVTEMSNAISANTTNIATNTGDIATLKGDIATLKTTVEENERVAAEGLTDLDTRVKALEAVNADTELTDVKSRLSTLETEVNTNIPQDIADAKAGAISEAATDATNKAAAAEAAAKKYTDDSIAGLDATATASDTYVTFTIAEVDGKVVSEGSSIAITTGAVAEGAAGLAVASDVKSYVDAQVAVALNWAEFL